MKNNTHNQIGYWGEKMAHRYLMEKGFVVLFRNWRYRKAEIDLVAFKDNFIVFVEVKTRKNKLFGRPVEFISEKKVNWFRIAAEHFLNYNNLTNEIRLDAIEIVGTYKNFEINHIERFY
jgi:putative endonuclease